MSWADGKSEIPIVWECTLGAMMRKGKTYLGRSIGLTQYITLSVHTNPFSYVPFLYLWNKAIKNLKAQAEFRNTQFHRTKCSSMVLATSISSPGGKS
jgi:hypothetical protein